MNLYWLISSVAALTCVDVHTANNYFCTTDLQVAVFDASPCAAGCTVAECCRPPQSCLEADLLYNISSQCLAITEQLLASNACAGLACNSTSTCCEKVPSCTALDSLLRYTSADASSRCSSLGLIFDSSSTCPQSGCDLGNCCRAPKCRDPVFGVPSFFYQCYALNQVYLPEVTCTGGCSTAQCCTRPTQCAQVASDVSYQCTYLSKAFASELACSSCDVQDCCVAPRTCNEAFQADPGFCTPLNQVFASASLNSSCPLGGCTTSCCRAPQTCGEFNTAFNSNVCTSQFLDVNSSQLCSGATQCKSVVRCCQSPPTCWNVRNLAPNPFAFCGVGSSWNDTDFLFFYQNTCEGGSCTPERCCKPITTCSQAFRAIANFTSEVCSPLGLIADYSKDNCTTCMAECCKVPEMCYEKQQAVPAFCSSVGLLLNEFVPCNGPCTTQVCCQAAKTCGEADSVVPGTLQQSCRAAQKFFNGSASCTTCNAAQCCFNPTNCSDIDLISYSPSYCGTTLVLGNNSCSNGVCSPSQCCVLPQTCSVQLGINPKYCSNVNLTPNNEDMIFFQQPCGGTCTTQRCCRTPRTCGEANTANSPMLLSYQCFSQQLAFDSFQFCTPPNCDMATCCRPARTCGETHEIDPQLPARWCAPDRMTFVDFLPCAGPCTPSLCCRPPSMCNQMPAAVPDFCLPTNRVFKTDNGSIVCNGFCSPDECCRAPQTCDEAQVTCGQYQALESKPIASANFSVATCCRPAVSCGELDLASACSSLGKLLNNSQPCLGSACTTALCCVAPLACDDFLDLNFQSCTAIGQVVKPTGRMCNGACTPAQCCSAPSTCEDAHQLSGFKLCFNHGVLNRTMSCVGSGCTPAVCCRYPSSCADVQVATSLQIDATSEWCSRGGFADRFDFTRCTGPCSAASCCQPLLTCDQWKDVWTRNNPPRGLGSATICQPGVFNAGGVCLGGVCDEKSCCRAPVTCQEANFEFLCIGHGAIRPGACFGASCSIATCCAPPLTCDQANQSPLCFGVGLVPIDSSPSLCEGTCTTTQCCRAPTTCDEAHLRVFTCPTGSLIAYSKTCSGSSCTPQNCCNRLGNCYDVMEVDPQFCRGYGFIDTSASFRACSGGACTQAQCCRTGPIACGETAVKNPTFCGGAVDFFKPCSGPQCNDTAFCCRAAANCGEAVGLGTVACVAGQVPDNQRLSACPSGGCSVTTCCKAVTTCADANVANGGVLCSGPSTVLLANTSCGGAVACSVSTCCRLPATCGEATAGTASFCLGALAIVNVQAEASLCAPTCSQSQCCRAPTSCVDAFTGDARLCAKISKVFNFSAGFASCSDCAAQCCIADTTFAPSSAPTTTPTPAVPANCPRTEFNKLVSECKSTDFQPPYNCTLACTGASTTLTAAFVRYNSSLARVCLDQALALVSVQLLPHAQDYIVNRTTTRTSLCITASVLNSAPMLSFSPLLGLLIFVGLL